VIFREEQRCRRSDGFTASHVSAAEKLRKGLWMHTCPVRRISLCHAPRGDPSQGNAFLGPDASAAGNLDLGAGVQLIETTPRPCSIADSMIVGSRQLQPATRSD